MPLVLRPVARSGERDVRSAPVDERVVDRRVMWERDVLRARSLDDDDLAWRCSPPTDALEFRRRPARIHF